VQPNWLAPLYPAFAICAAIWLSRAEAFPGARQRTNAWQASALAVGFLMSGLIYLHAIYPLTLVPGAKDPTSQMRGWPELAAQIETVRKEQAACWVATSSYATTGQLAYALAGRAPVVQLTEELRYVHLPRVSDAVLGCAAIYVELQRRQAPEILRTRFASVIPLGELTRRYRSVPIATYAVYRLAQPIGPVSPGRSAGPSG